MKKRLARALSTVLIAIVSTVSPIIGFAGSVVKYLLSSARRAWMGFVVDVVGLAVPGGLVKNLISGLISDVIEATSPSDAADHVVPLGPATMECGVCGTYTRYYVKEAGTIKCKECFTDEVDERVSYGDKVYVLKNNVYRVHDELTEMNRLTLTAAPQPEVRAVRDVNLHADSDADIVERYGGVRMSFSMKCKPCKGRGFYGSDRRDTCRVCQGRGRIEVTGRKRDYHRCPPCKGHGYYFRDPKATCDACNGIGVVTRMYAE